jgi:hypothetical protein
MNNEIKKYTGAVSIDADITPTTREPIDQVDSGNWSDLSISDLYDQKITLESRLAFAVQHCPAMVTQIRRGIAAIDSVISQKGAKLPSSGGLY